MRDIVPLLLLVLNCCVGPIAVFSLGIFIGRHGSPITLNRGWLAGRTRPGQEKSGRVLVD